MINTIAYPRAALIGNPSDGYFGKTIAFVFSNFKVQVELKENKYLEIIPDNRDRLSFKCIDELSNDVTRNGYYGGIRLLKATIKTFHDYCREHAIGLSDKNFTITFSSDIPERLGLAGSSAIVTAAMKAIMQFYGVEIEKPTLANLILSVEKDELKIGAGLQDRVAQVYKAPVLMNFDNKLMRTRGYGEYLPFDKKLLPSLYIAYRLNLSEGSEITHNDLASRYAKKDPAVIDAVKQWIKLTEQVWKKLQRGDKDIGTLLDRNFDIRHAVCNISAGNIELVETARSAGASAKFTGSGGAIIGTYEGEQMFKSLTAAMKKIGAVVIKPEIV
jgi:glucuronokinase